MPADGGRSDIPLLLLHGAGSESGVWRRHNTLGLLSAAGYRAVAVDLPGWGRSKGSQIQNTPEARTGFLQAFIKQKRLERPVIVAPSMSGSYAIPYMMSPQPESCESRLRGFVSIAAVYSPHYSHAQYHRCEVPTMVVYGSKDLKLGLESVGNLRNLARSEIFTMEGAGHGCNEERPDEWHRLLYNYLVAVEREQD